MYKHICHTYSHAHTRPNIFVALILIVWHREKHMTHIGSEKLSWNKRRSNSLPPDRSNTVSCQLSSTSVSCHKGCVKNTIPITWPVQHLTIIDNSSEIHSFSIQNKCVFVSNCTLGPAVFRVTTNILTMYCAL